MNIDEAVASVIRGLRKKARLTHQDVGDFVGLARQTVWKIEKNQASCKLTTLQKLADLYG